MSRDCRDSILSKLIHRVGRVHLLCNITSNRQRGRCSGLVISKKLVGLRKCHSKRDWLDRSIWTFPHVVCRSHPLAAKDICWMRVQFAIWFLPVNAAHRNKNTFFEKQKKIVFVSKQNRSNRSNIRIWTEYYYSKVSVYYLEFTIWIYNVFRDYTSKNSLFRDPLSLPNSVAAYVYHWISYIVLQLYHPFHYYNIASCGTWHLTTREQTLSKVLTHIQK